MGKYITMLLLACALILAVVVPLAGKPRTAKRMTISAGVIAAIGGLLLYGYSYLILMEGHLLAIVHAFVAVCCMFVAEIDASILGEVSSCTTGR